MANQTINEGIVKTASSPEARPGHSLVVYEESSRGRRFVKVVPPGMVFQPPMLSFGKRYIGFWTMAGPYLKLQIARDCKTRDQLYNYTLNILLFYQVSQPAQLIERLDADPVTCLRERAAQLALERLEFLDWQAIKEGGTGFRAAVLTGEGTGGRSSPSFLSQLSSFAMDYGLEITQVEVDRALPQDELGAELSVKEVEVKRGKFRAESTLNIEIQQHEQGTKMRGIIDSVVNSVNDMLIRAGEKVETYPDMKRALVELSQVRALASQLVVPGIGGHAPAQMGGRQSGGDGQFYAGISSHGEDPLGRFLAEFCSLLAPIDRQYRFQLLSDSLHVVAEIILDGSGAGSHLLDKYRQRIKAARERDDDLLDGEQSRFLRRIAESESLGRQLRGETN